jgi:hypothetical protein
VVDFSSGNARMSKLRIKARSTMVEALEMLNVLGDELPAAKTLQHAIDRLSEQNADVYGLSDR